MNLAFQVLAAGDSALLVQLEQRISPLVNDWCIATRRLIERRLGRAVRDVVIGYCSLTVYFDPLATDAAWLEEELRRLAAVVDAGPEDDERADVIDVPVCYGGEFGPDLSEVARFGQCSNEEVVALHAGRVYRVYLVGFVPGFAYMAEVDPRIAVPRRQSPRTAVPPGSVAIAGGQTGIYPSSTPGGWNIIGRTPLKPYDASRAQPSLFKAGDRVRFRALAQEGNVKFEF
ncbi:MAG TPA: 5-oxoprolinase subunit PxpB [Vicinamibacterales bacterium]|nr:5-oxoprolinase subunit PxpB [Vicinamibacterales bacterium]